jgi:hypothetical protein
MVQINELSADMNPQNFNQMTRWVNTKEEHANKIIHLAADYSLAQRVKAFGSGMFFFFFFFALGFFALGFFNKNQDIFMFSFILTQRVFYYFGQTC